MNFPTLNNLKLPTLVRNVVVGAGLICALPSSAAISVIDAGSAPDVYKPEKKITWYLIDMPFRQESSVNDYDKLVPVQNYTPQVTPELRYFLPPKQYRYHNGDIAQRCELAGKEYAGRLGAFFMLAHNSYGYDISDTNPSTKVAIPPAQSGSFVFWHQSTYNCAAKNDCTLPNGLIQQLIHSPYSFELEHSDEGLRFPYLFASVAIAPKQLNILEKRRFRPYQPIMMTVHHPSSEVELVTNTMLGEPSGTNGRHVFAYLDRDSAHVQVKNGIYTLKPHFEDRYGGVNKFAGTPEYRRLLDDIKPVDIASQANIFVACREKEK